MQHILTIIAVFDLLMIGIVAISAVLAAYEWLYLKINPRLPFCDIDPRCHVEFHLDKDGNGWIRDCLVIQASRSPSVRAETEST